MLLLRVLAQRMRLAGLRRELRLARAALASAKKSQPTSPQRNNIAFLLALSTAYHSALRWA